ncbi:TPA: hypothetical protein G9C53_004922 [Salmonella enterica subsp. enterica serovar Typhimurium var. 5-]|uniref:Uncharacterized protein n=1 Tax=Salmonella enterica subsp. enterica serovar Typhimurium var. 5- TaxID=1620419 RepID=A0A740QIX9_SALTM|nr:hypothetical protein [Salmonella enterica subsp. enterica serovar Typhimurium var. 5-]
MTIESLEIVFYTLLFVVPGFITDSVYRYCYPQREDTGQYTIIRYLWFTFINYILWFPLIYLILSNDFHRSHPLWSFVISGFLVLVGPGILGFIISIIIIQGWLRKILQKFGFNPIHVIPTSWDYQFNRIENYAYVIICFIDGSTLGGLYSNQSFASSKSEERDIYLEKVYDIDTDGNWIEKDNTYGIWIASTDIRAIEFLKGGE